MKKLAVLLVLLFVVSYTTNYAQDWQSQDISPNVTVQSDSTPPANWTYPTVFNWHYENVAGVNGGSVGAMYFGGRYLVNKWNATIMYRYNGGWGGPTSLFDSVTYVAMIRDLTTDGTYLYGGSATATLYKFNADGTSAGTITLGSPAVARAVAYTPAENGFFVSNFSDNIILCNATTGAVIRTLTGTSALAGKYGMAYSNIPGDVPALWVWGQATLADPYNILTKVNPQTGATIATYRFGPLPIPTGATSPSGISGGAEVCVINNAYVLLLNYQNWALTGHRLAAVIPVELTSFTANVVDSRVSLNWSTATETNNRGFEIQRSSTDGVYNTVAFVNGVGTSTDNHNYSFTDKNVEVGKYSYRLRQVDYDGHSEFSKAVEVELTAPSKFELVQNYPNPFNPNTTISFSLATDSKVTLRIYDLIGQELSVLVNGDLSAGNHSVKFDASKLSSGMYIYRLEASGVNGSNYSSVRKMILNK